MEKILFPLITSLLFSGSYIAGKYTTDDLDPLTTTLLRYVVALAFLLLLLVHYRSRVLRVATRDLFVLNLMGLSGIVGYHYFFFLSLRYTEVANTAIINALTPLLTAVAAAVLVKEWLHGRNYVGVMVAAVGVVLLLCGGDIQRLAKWQFNRGDLLMLLAVTSWTIYALLIKRLTDRYSSYTLVLYATIFGVLWLLVLMPWPETVTQIRGISLRSLCSVLFMGVFVSGLGYLTYNMSIHAIGATRTSSFVHSCVPVWVALLALVFLQQAITLVMVVSTALILVGLKLMMSTTGDRL